MTRSKEKLTAVGITCGVGSMLIGAKQAGFKVLGNIEWRGYYSRVDEQGRNTFREYFKAPLVRRIEDLAADEVERMTGATLAFSHPECIVSGDVPVYTADGWRPIKGIEVGELVMTHKGRFRPVVRVFRNTMVKGAPKIRLYASTEKTHGKALTVTANHPIRTSDGRWVRADEVSAGDSIRVLARRCESCGSWMPMWASDDDSKRCSVSCSTKEVWSLMEKVERVNQTSAAHVKTRARRNFLKSGRSKLEETLEGSLVEVGIPPESQYPIGGYYVDLAIPDKKIAIECDGGNFHNMDDPRRQEEIEAAGWTVLRFDGSSIESDPRRCAEVVERVFHNYSGSYSSVPVTVTRVEVQTSEQDRTVYNLGVAEDSSYIAKGFVMKNCGNFSNMRVDKTAALTDPGDIPLAMDLVGKLKPRFFAMDDLPKSFMAYTMEEYVNALPDYDLFPEWISNYNYGNIQKNRKRFFMIGALKNEGFTFQAGEEPNITTVRDLIEDLVRSHGKIPNTEKHVEGNENCGRAKDMYGYGNRFTWADLKNYFKNKPSGEVMTYDSSSGVRKSRFGFGKGHWDSYAYVLTGGSPIIHPIRNTPMNIRELARIQGAPDDFEFYGTKVDSKGRWNIEKNIHMVKQVGKFMPVQFCNYVSKQVSAHVNEKKFRPSGRRFLAPNQHIDDAKMWYCENVGYTNQKGACTACWVYDPCDAKHKVKI